MSRVYCERRCDAGTVPMRGLHVIRHTSMQRLGMAIVCGPVIVFAIVGLAANLVGGHWGDVLGLAAFVVFLAAFAGLRWTRFVRVDDGGLTYRNWIFVRTLPWGAIKRVAVRSLLEPRVGGWAVVGHKPRGLPVTLRATRRGGSYRQSPAPGLLAVQALARELDARRIGAAERRG